MGSYDDARLYIAGSSSAVPRPGRANSGYVVRTTSTAIGIDFGTGVFSHVRELLDVTRDLTAIVISHMHADHFFDLIPLRYALRYELKRETLLPVYLPPAGISALTHIAHPLKETDDFFGDVFELREYGPGTTLHIGDATLTFAPALHYIPAYAMRLVTPRGIFAFSADTAPCDSVPELAKDADLFLCEAALGPNGVETGSVRGHCNAVEAAQMATLARAKHLVLTHYGTFADPQGLRESAASAYDGPITIADDGLSIALVQALLNEHV